MLPVASTCPWTKCPPIRASARTGRSRFTWSPRCSEPSAETLMVSGEISMWTPSAGSADTTVRQTPFTASESPGVSSADKSVCRRSRKPAGVGFISATWPTVSINPVNMRYAPLYQHIGAEPQSTAVVQRLPGEPASANPVHSHGADGGRADIDVDGIDHGGVERGAVQRGAPFEHQRGHPACVKRAESRLKIAG